MSQQLRELQARKSALVQKARALTERAATDNRDMSDEEVSAFDALKARIDSASGAIDRESSLIAEEAQMAIGALIGDYIAQDNPLRAGSFVSELRAHCEKICLNPAGYRRRPELADDLRSCAHGNSVIFFESTTEQVTIVRIWHGARDIPEVLSPS